VKYDFDDKIVLGEAFSWVWIPLEFLQFYKLKSI
jgi:hypothetical protein